MSKIYQNRGGTLTLVSDDDNAVHKTGNETIAGTKTFSSTITGSVSGNAGTATQFSANTTVALTGDATGTSAGSKKGWSVPVTLANSGVTAGSYGPSANATPGYGATFNVPYITVDAKGRVTAAATHTVKIPASDDTNNKVAQTVSTENLELPLLAKDSNGTSTVTSGSKFAAAVKLNPSTGTITATKFVGPLTGDVTGGCSGNAGSATKLATARNIAVSGAVTGSASFNGTANSTISTIWRSCMVGQSGSTNTNPWYKVASFAATTANDDIEAVFLVENTYSTHTYGLLKLHVRTNGSKVIDANASSLAWISHNGFTLADFVLVMPTAASSTFELWTKIDVAYQYRRFTVLSEGSRTGTSVRFTFHPASSAGQAASITTAGTQKASTFTGQASSCTGNAATATKLATARSINGTNFDGSANITTANWGTARNIYISDSDGTNTGSAVSVNGSANATLKLPATIKASITGNCSGTSANVTGTVAIDHGGTGATTRLNAVKALTNENVGSGANYFLTITSSWGKAGYTSIADAKTALGLGSAAYTDSTDYATASHTHSYLPLSGGTMTGNIIMNNAKVIQEKVTSMTRATAPSANVYYWPLQVLDNAGKSVGGVYYEYNTAKQATTHLMCYKGTTNDNTWTSLKVGYDSNGNWFTYAPTPATSDNTTKIATTAYVQNQGYGKAIKGITRSGTTFTYTCVDGTTGTFTQQDNNTTYSNFVKSGSTAAAGLVPKPSTTAGTTKYLREDCTWQVPPNTVYTHPTTSGNKHIPSGGSSGQILRWSADGTAAWGADNNTTYSAATTSANGLMTAAMVTKLNGIATSAGKYTLVATWTQPNQAEGTILTKTISGCTAGQPIFLVHKGTAGTYKRGFCLIDVASGAVHVSGTKYPQYILGTFGDPGKPTWMDENWATQGGGNIFIIIPNASSVSVYLEYGEDDVIYVYKT